MRKIYFAAAIAAISCSSMVAGQRYQAQSLKIENVKAELSSVAAKVETVSAKSMKAPAKAEAVTDLNGVYDWAYRNLLSQASPTELTITVTDEATGEAIISGFPAGVKINAIIDVAAGTVSVPNKQDLGEDANGDPTYFYLRPVSDEGNIGTGASDAEASVGTITGNTITFPVLDVWAIGDSWEATQPLYWCLTYANELNKQTEKILVGIGTVSGDFFFNMFVEDSEPTDYEVEVYKGEGDDTKLLVKNPLKGVYQALGFNGESPDMIVDITVPDNVLIPEFSLGINGGDAHGLYYGLSYSANSNDISTTPAANRISYEETEDAITLTMPYHSMFLWPSNTTSLYYGNSTVVTITIPLEGSAVKVIGGDEVNAPVEYYNLQGMRVANPAAGQLLIKKQGEKVEKVMAF
ncbi:MAG: hypothetical protein K2M87_05705 [Muribaculaceae bacterium]|nr:hypothetical protein [Muribaculaceae bacterium]